MESAMLLSGNLVSNHSVSHDTYPYTTDKNQNDSNLWNAIIVHIFKGIINERGFQESKMVTIAHIADSLKQHAVNDSLKMSKISFLHIWQHNHKLVILRMQTKVH